MKILKIREMRITKVDAKKILLADNIVKYYKKYSLLWKQDQEKIAWVPLKPLVLIIQLLSWARHKYTYITPQSSIKQLK